MKDEKTREEQDIDQPMAGTSERDESEDLPLICQDSGDERYGMTCSKAMIRKRMM